jgi:hypothetical protein
MPYHYQFVKMNGELAKCCLGPSSETRREFPSRHSPGDFACRFDFQDLCRVPSRGQLPTGEPGSGMRVFGIVLMVFAAIFCPISWMVITEGSMRVLPTSLIGFICWNLMFVAGAVFYGCGKIVTQIHLAAAQRPG